MILVLGLLAVAGLADFQVPGLPPQTAPDIFSCVVPTRVATGTLTYRREIVAGSPSTTVRTIERVNIGGADLIRSTWKSDAAQSTVEMDAATLVPIRFRHLILTPNAGPDGRLLGALALRDGFVRGQFQFDPSLPPTPVAVDAQGRRLAFGDLGRVIAAVDWDKCPEVRVNQVSPTGERVLTYRRVGAGTVSFEGLERKVFEIHQTGGAQSRYWITQAAPYLILKQNSPEIPEPSVLVSYSPSRR